MAKPERKTVPIQEVLKGLRTPEKLTQALLALRKDTTPSEQMGDRLLGWEGATVIIGREMDLKTHHANGVIQTLRKLGLYNRGGEQVDGRLSSYWVKKAPARVTQAMLDAIKPVDTVQAEIDRLTAENDQLRQGLTDLDQRLAALSTKVADNSFGIDDRVDNLVQTIAELAAQLAKLGEVDELKTMLLEVRAMRIDQKTDGKSDDRQLERLMEVIEALKARSIQDGEMGQNLTSVIVRLSDNLAQS